MAATQHLIPHQPTLAIRPNALLSADLIMHACALLQFFPSGGWLTTTPTTAVTAGAYPSSGTTLRGSTTLSYTWTLSNTLLCFNGAAVGGVARATVHASEQPVHTLQHSS